MDGDRAGVIKQEGAPLSTWLFPAIAPVEMPVGLKHFGLKHLDSDLFWCDPIIEVDEIGEEIVLYRQVSWN